MMLTIDQTGFGFMQKELSFFTLETNAEFKDTTLSFSSVVFYRLF